MKTLLTLLIVLLAIIFLLGTLRTAQTQSQPEQKDFLKGTVPSPLPNGFQKGGVNATTSWLGKVFDAKNHTGMNLFEESGKQVTRYPFITYTGNGQVDHNTQVLKLDYNLPSNPLYLRFIVDELVQIHPGKYLGKLNVKFGPIAFALGFFTLSN